MDGAHFSPESVQLVATAEALSRPTQSCQSLLPGLYSLDRLRPSAFWIWHVVEDDCNEIKGDIGLPEDRPV